MADLTLYGRGYCHLCDDMKQALVPLQQQFGFTLHEVDVDSDDDLEARLGELVPVLMTGTPARPGRELCHYFADLAAIRAWLADPAQA
jgi:glutaredoxin